MTELFDAIASPWNLAWVLLVFGFAPGFVLRLLVKLYPKGDPRRDELVAELYTVPRLQRPLWVAEQIEVAIFEGPRQRRLRRRTRGRRRMGAVALAWAAGAELVVVVLLRMLEWPPWVDTAMVVAAALSMVVALGELMFEAGVLRKSLRPVRPRHRRT